MAVPKKIEFLTEVPPSTRGKQRRPSKYAHIVQACLNNPGAWTIFNDCTSVSTSSSLRIQYPGFEFKARSIQNETTKGRVTVYGRFVGTQE